MNNFLFNIKYWIECIECIDKNISATKWITLVLIFFLSAFNRIHFDAVHGNLILTLNTRFELTLKQILGILWLLGSLLEPGGVIRLVWFLCGIW